MSEKGRAEEAVERSIKRKNPVLKSTRAGLTFPVSRVQKNLKIATGNDSVYTGAAIYMTAVLEYLTAEVLELSGNAAKDNKKQRINPRHIQLAIGHDEELSKLLSDVTISEGGVIPNINPMLLPKRSHTNPSKAGPSQEL